MCRTEGRDRHVRRGDAALHAARACSGSSRRRARRCGSRAPSSTSRSRWRGSAARAAWVSRLPDNALGRRLAAHARANGVDTDGVRVVRGRPARAALRRGRTARRGRARASTTAADSAFATLDPAAFDWPALLDGARALPHERHHAGAVAGVRSARPRDALARAPERRLPHLVRPQLPRAALTTPRRRARNGRGARPAHRHADRVGGRGRSGVRARRRPRRRRGRSCVTGSASSASSSRAGSTTGENDAGCAGARASTARSFEVESPEFRTVDPLGGGDAFSAGFLSGLLDGRTPSAGSSSAARWRRSSSRSPATSRSSTPTRSSSCAGAAPTQGTRR